jgi:hypothetical protein
MLRSGAATGRSVVAVNRQIKWLSGLKNQAECADRHIPHLLVALEPLGVALEPCVDVPQFAFGATLQHREMDIMQQPVALRIRLPPFLHQGGENVLLIGCLASARKRGRACKIRA